MHNSGVAVVIHPVMGQQPIISLKTSSPVFYVGISAVL